MPSGTAEVGLFAMNVLPVNGKLFFDWALMGLSPKSRGVNAGALPAGAAEGRNSAGKLGYSFCPPRGPRPEHMIIRIIALKHPIAAKPGFDPAAVFQETEQDTNGVALTGAAYVRR